MQSQSSKMKFISMFYLLVFTSALLLSGLLSSQQPTGNQANGKRAFIKSVADSTNSVKQLPIITEPTEDSDEADKGNHLIPFDFNFNFNSLIQWFFKLPTQHLSYSTGQKNAPTQKRWLTNQDLRI